MFQRVDGSAEMATLHVPTDDLSFQTLEPQYSPPKQQSACHDSENLLVIWSFWTEPNP
jgi:hypothetical protein